jgi:hypothetical protein
LPLSEKDRAQLEDEKFDPVRAYPCCPLHGYYGPYRKNDQFRGAMVVPAVIREHPVLGCANCIKVYWLCDIASVPPSQRAERFEELEEVMHKMLEQAEKGLFDFTAFRHAQITYDE